MKRKTTCLVLTALVIAGCASSGPSKEEYQALQERLNQLERQGQQQQGQQPAPQTAPAQQSQQYTTESHFQTEAISGGLRITGYTGPGGDVRIPPTINGQSVVAIGDSAFSGGSGFALSHPGVGLTNITIPGSVRTIGKWAFAGNKQLTTIIFSHGVTTIEDYAFDECPLTSITIPNSVTTIARGAFRSSQLTTITIPDSVTRLGLDPFGNRIVSVSVGTGFVDNRFSQVFGSCSSLTAINIAAGNPVYSSVDGVVYNKTGTTLIYWPKGKTPVNIPSSVTTIGGNDRVFEQKMTSIIIPNNVTVINGMEDKAEGRNVWHIAFSRNDLISITIGANVTINGLAFSTLDRWDMAISNGFKEAYNNGGKRAGTYTRPSTDSTTWTRQ